jgi:hypothetical protein
VRIRRESLKKALAERVLLQGQVSEIRDLAGGLEGDFYMERDWRCPLD